MVWNVTNATPEGSRFFAAARRRSLSTFFSSASAFSTSFLLILCARSRARASAYPITFALRVMSSSM